MKSKTYSRLTQEQRCQLYALWQNKVPQNRIADMLNVHPSTVCRELKRNKNKRGGYHHRSAQEYTDERKERFRRARKLTYEVENKLKRLLE